MSLSDRPCHETGCDAEAAPERSRCYPHYGTYRNVSEAVRAEERAKAARGDMKVLFIDIETSPNLAWCWGLWQQNVGLNQLVSSTEILCFAAKWAGDADVLYYRGTEDELAAAAWALLNEADVVVHFYGSRFDIPHLNRAFVTHGFPPPLPYRQIDLKTAVAKRFKFPSNKLEYVSRALGLGGKVKHEGFSLWTRCMAGDEDAWALMQEYNQTDVTLLEELYEILLPWLPGHPSRNLYGGGGCPVCGAPSESVLTNGYVYTAMSRFPAYTCEECGAHFRSNKRDMGVAVTAAVL